MAMLGRSGKQGDRFQESLGRGWRWLRPMLLLLCGLVAGRQGLAQLQNTPMTFTGETAVGSSQTVILTLPTQAAGTVTSVVAVTGGAPNLDFAVTGSTCAVNQALSYPGTCVVTVKFSPRFPGIRQGAVLVESGSQLLASATLSGIAQGGLPVLVPGEINTVAGDTQWTYQQDGVKAVAASIFLPTGLTVNGAGELFLCDSSNNRVRYVDTTGTIHTVAGTGTPGTSGDGQLAINAEVNNPSGIAMDGAGNLYIADTGGHVVRRVDAVTGIITTIAGQVNQAGYAGDGMAATSALLSSPQGLALTPGGDLLIADAGNNTVREVVFASGNIYTIAGTNHAGYNGDARTAISASLNGPTGVAVRADGAVAIADTANNRIRLISTAGMISTVAGNGIGNFSGDNQPATQAELYSPSSVAFDPAGDLLIADAGNNRIRGVFGSPGTITTLAGSSSQQFSGDGGPANEASLYGPSAVFFDSKGNIWLSDFFHNRVREINGSLLGITYPAMKVGKVSTPVAGMLYNGGNTTLTLDAPLLNQAQLDPGTTTCNQSPMAPMAFCDMGVEFAPTTVAANVNGSVSWASNAPNVTPMDALNGEVLSVEPTTVAITANLNPGMLGQPVVLTATVTSDDTGRTGTVGFSEGSNVWCAAVPLASNGTASCTIQSLALGSHVFTANYSGDDNNAASTSQPYTEIIKQQPALALAVSSSPAVVTNNVTLTLTAADQTGTPSGTVIFYDGTTALATVPLNAAGFATWSSQTFGVGLHALSAQYSGDSANAPGTSNTVNEQITQANTLTVLASSNANATVGSAVNLTATVVSNNGPAPTGTVQFSDEAGVLGSAPVGANGTASLSVASLPTGSHSLKAVYSGDTDDASSTSAVLPETIEPIATVSTLGADANPLSAGATLHLTAIVALAPGATADGQLAGIVTFTDGGKVLGSAALNATGQATLAVSTLTVGAHTIVASFDGSANYATITSAVLNENVQQTASQITLSSASATTLEGKTATFTVAVSSETGVPTGTVSFRDNGTVIGTATLDANGDASLSTAKLTPGTHTITAVYSGDANYVGSTSAGLKQTVQLAQPTLTLSGPTAAVDAGTPAQFLAALTTPGTAPTGTLTLLDGGVAIGSATVTANGSFPFSTVKLAIGTHTITAAYSGDSDNAAVTSAAVTVVVQQAKSTITLTSSANPLTMGGALSLSATVSSDSPSASGQVNFYDGTTLLGKASLSQNGTASLMPTALGLGTHSLTAVYVGDTNHAASTSAPVPELVVASSAASLSSSNNPAASGQDVTFTAQIHGAGTAAPTGSATLRDNGALLAAVPLNAAGAATFTTNALSVGTHTITMTYPGDSNFAATGAQLTQTVIDSTTQVALSASANPATYGQPLSLTATVTSNGGVATGTVAFLDGSTTIGSAPLNGSGVAVLTLSTLAPGAHTIVANYEGDGRANPSNSTGLVLAVKQTTAVAVNSNANPALTLAPVSFTAVISNAGAAPATGTVTFTDGGVTLGTATLDGSGHATITVPQMSAGTHAVVANYPGDGANFASVSANYREAVQLRATATTVTGSPTDPTNPQQITLIAVVKGDGSVSPSGTVTFTSGALSLGQAIVDETGVATITVIFPATSEPVVASYAGDLSYAASQSAATSIAAGQAAQFTLAVNAPSVTLVTHQHTTINVSLGSVKGFTDTISLGCVGLPFAGTCTFTPSQVKLAPNGAMTATLVLDTGDPLGAGTGTTASLRKDGTTLFSWLPVGLLLGLLQRRKGRDVRRKLGTLIALALVFAITMGVTGCSGLSTSGTPPGSYSFKVVGTGQGSGVTQTETITLVVTQ